MARRTARMKPRPKNPLKIKPKLQKTKETGKEGMVLRSGRRKRALQAEDGGKGKIAATTRQRQSPIDIRADVVCHDPKKCQAESLCISYAPGDCCDVSTSAAGFRVNVGMNCTTSLSAKHLPGDFQLAQFHAHWSGNGRCGSEHLLNGKAMSGEVHMVFWNKKYKGFDEAAEKVDGLAVIGIFLKEGRRSKVYEPLFDVVRRSNECHASVPMPKDFTLEQLLPEHHDFVTYLGSLTTPPFSENVIWTVLIEPIEVSKEQLDVLRNIVASNFRECQDLCDREILASTAVTAR